MNERNESDRLYKEMREIMQKAEKQCKEKLEQFNIINGKDPTAKYTDARLGWYFIMKPGSD